MDIDEIDLAINLLKAGMAMDVPFSARVFSYCDPLENQLTYENGKYTLKTMYAISMPDGSNHKQIQKETIGIELLRSLLASTPSSKTARRTRRL